MNGQASEPTRRVTRSTASAKRNEDIQSNDCDQPLEKGKKTNAITRQPVKQMQSRQSPPLANATAQQNQQRGRSAAIAELAKQRSQARNSTRQRTLRQQQKQEEEEEEEDENLNEIEGEEHVEDERQHAEDGDGDELEREQEQEERRQHVDDDDEFAHAAGEHAALSTSISEGSMSRVMPSSSPLMPDVHCSSSVEDFDPQEADQASRDVPTYAPLVGRYLRLIEDQYRPSILNYIDSLQSDINAAMREILIAWLVDVAEEFTLQQETLFLTKNYIDRYLSQVVVGRNNLQLVGITCMLIASKYEEMQPPTIDDFIHMTENSYTREEMIRFEIEILGALEFRLGAPTEFCFLRKYFVQANADLPRQRNFHVYLFSSFLLERTLQSVECLQFPPSLLASACLFLARHTLGHDAWTSDAARCTGFEPTDAVFRRAIVQVHQIHQLAYRRKGDLNLETVVEKYGQARWQQISALKPALTLPFAL